MPNQQYEIHGLKERNDFQAYRDISLGCAYTYDVLLIKENREIEVVSVGSEVCHYCNELLTDLETFGEPIESEFHPSQAVPIAKHPLGMVSDKSFLEKLNEELSPFLQKVTKVEHDELNDEIEFYCGKSVLFSVDFSRNAITTTDDCNWIPISICELIKAHGYNLGQFTAYATRKGGANG